jgi:ribosome-associated heat shock protein Hsp15
VSRATDEADDARASVRLDRWLWAARFFKTRSLAKEAIAGGKVRCQGQRTKPSKEIGVGSELEIQRGDSEQCVIVTGLSERRGGAQDAAALYRETPESIQRREQAQAQRSLSRRGAMPPPVRPSKRDRRQLKQLKQQNSEPDR